MRQTAITDLMSCLATRFTLSKINDMGLYPLSEAHHLGVLKVENPLLRFKECSFLSVTQMLPLMQLECMLASFLHFFSAYGRVNFFNETVDYLQWYRKFRDFLLPVPVVGSYCLPQPVISPGVLLATQGTTWVKQKLDLDGRKCTLKILY